MEKSNHPAQLAAPWEVVVGIREGLCDPCCSHPATEGTSDITKDVWIYSPEN